MSSIVTAAQNQPQEAPQILGAFIALVESQTGQHIDPQMATILIEDAVAIIAGSE